MDPKRSHYHATSGGKAAANAIEAFSAIAQEPAESESNSKSTNYRKCHQQKPRWSMNSLVTNG